MLTSDYPFLPILAMGTTAAARKKICSQFGCLFLCLCYGSGSVATAGTGTWLVSFFFW